MLETGRDPLAKYRAKRDFAKTPEPPGVEGESGEQTIFVIQKHRASRLHYDFRLEVNGVLKSWAVPKGPSLNPVDKRLAMAVEDHPIEYADFEGVIPDREYGAGAVIVWDIGFYRNTTEKHGKPVSADEAIRDGHIRFTLVGTKLRGGFALTRTGIGKPERWILVKTRDQDADVTGDIIAQEPRSALAGRTLEEVAAET